MFEMPALTILLTERLLIHEQYDEQRARPLTLKIRSSGVFRNPTVVAPLKDGTDRYMVLDGANRVTALRHLGIKHVLAQVAQPDDPGLTLYNWNHVVWELDPLRLIQGIQQIRKFRLSTSEITRLKPACWVNVGLHWSKTAVAGSYLSVRRQRLSIAVFGY